MGLIKNKYGWRPNTNHKARLPLSSKKFLGRFFRQFLEGIDLLARFLFGPLNRLLCF